MIFARLLSLKLPLLQPVVRPERLNLAGVIYNVKRLAEFHVEMTHYYVSACLSGFLLIFGLIHTGWVDFSMPKRWGRCYAAGRQILQNRTIWLLCFPQAAQWFFAYRIISGYFHNFANGWHI